MKRTEEEAMKLYNDNEKLIYATINRRYNDFNFRELHGLDKCDIKQFGSLGLYKACKEYDSSKGVKFSSFAISHIRWSIQTEAKRDSLGSNGKWTFDLADRTSLDKVLYYDNHGLEVTASNFIETRENGYDDVLVDDMLDAISKKICPRIAKMIQMRAEGHSYQGVADVFETTHQNVRQRIKQNRDKIADLLQTT